MTTAPSVPTRRETASIPSNRESAALLVSAAITALTLATAFGLLALGVDSFWIVFILGFGVVMPTALGILTHRWPTTGRTSLTPTSNTSDPVEELQLQYVRGEITEAEFEHRVATLLASNDGE